MTWQMTEAAWNVSQAHVAPSVGVLGAFDNVADVSVAAFLLRDIQIAVFPRNCQGNTKTQERPPQALMESVPFTAAQPSQAQQVFILNTPVPAYTPTINPSKVAVFLNAEPL